MKKEICKNCAKKLWKVVCWDEHDEKRWDDGTVFCIMTGNLVSNKEPPKTCKFYLEQIISKKEKNEDSR